MADASKAMAKLGKIDFEGLITDLRNLLQTADKGLSQLQFDEINAAVRRAADAITALASSPDLKATLVAAHGALDDLSKTLNTLQAQLGPVGSQLTPALAELRKTLVGLQKTTQQVNSTLAPEGELRYGLTGTLGELGEMAKSLQRLSEFLERNPNSLIFGRKPPTNNSPKRP